MRVAPLLAAAVALVACGPTSGAPRDAGPDPDARTLDAAPGPDGGGPVTLAGTLAVAARDVALTPAGSARQPAVAFHGAADAFVAAYTWVLPDTPTPRFRIEVRAVTVDAAGTPAPSDPVMVDGDVVTHDALDVAVAAPAGPEGGPALVVWNDDRSAPGAPGALEILGALVTVTGGAAPAVSAPAVPLAVSEVPGTSELLPGAGWDAAASQFLVTWGDERERGVRDPDARVIFGRTVSPAGDLGTEVRVGDEGLFQTWPQVASCDAGTFLVAWTDYRTEGATLISRYRGRLHDAVTGAPTTDIVTYGEAPGLAQDPPGIACSRRTGGWGVAWTVPGPPSLKQVATAVLHPDGTLAAGPTTVTAAADGARCPALAHVWAVNGYVASTLAQDSTFGYALELDPDGVAASPLHPLTAGAPGLGTFWSAVAAHATRPLALVVMTLDYDRVHATTLLGPAALP